MCRWTEEEVGHMIGLPRHRHFVGFFNVPVKAPTWATLFTVFRETAPIAFSRLLTTTRMGIRKTYNDSPLKIRSPHVFN